MADILSLYPGAATAIEVAEALKQWEMYRRTADVEGIESLRQRMRESCENARDKSQGEWRAILDQALAEWDHPDFLKYLRAKLGAM